MSSNPFDATTLKSLEGFGKYYSIPELKDARSDTLPYCIRILLECAMRNCGSNGFSKNDVDKILNWHQNSLNVTEVPFTPSRVLLQDFTGVPAVVDLAAMRDAVVRMGGDPKKINPLIPTDLVVDHSVQADFSRDSEALEKNQELEYQRNGERFAFLKWGANAFSNMLIVPPGSGIVHQVNLEYLARGIFNTNGMLYPDSLVGTDSHTTMINGLGVLGWGVGGIEAEAVMLGQPITMVLPEVIGFKLIGSLKLETTATDVVLTVTHMLRKRGVVGKFVEFFGEGVNTLSLADRATIANMAPEYGATMGYFPMDKQTIIYLKQTGRSDEHVKMIETYLKAQNLYADVTACEKIKYSGELMVLDLSTVEGCLAGPKRPHDLVQLKNMKADFLHCLTNPVGFKGFGLSASDLEKTATFNYKGNTYTLSHGSVVIAAITSCTNTSNPSVMIGAGLLARNAKKKNLCVKPYVKTSLSPGSGIVMEYLKASDLLSDLESMGFYLAGFGCMTCIGNSGDLDDEVSQVINTHDITAAAVLSGNRNFEGRVHPQTSANYLASPLLVVAYALAGTVCIDFKNQPIGYDIHNKPVYLSEIWPSQEEIKEYETKHVLPKMFSDVYSRISQGTQRWTALKVSDKAVYDWDDSSTYIHNPPFFQTTQKKPAPVSEIKNAYCLLNLGDSVTTDHISPAGNIAKVSPAGEYLSNRGVERHNFNSYGSRRGNDEIMVRGTFSNIRLRNKMASKTGPYTMHVPTNEEMFVYDAAMKYKANNESLIVLAGKEYGSGSSRDWAAKGPHLLGVQAVIAESFERIHRSNLIGMGILPLQFKNGQNADSLGFFFSPDIRKYEHRK